MFLATFDFIASALAVAFSATAIKLIDDYLDRENDAACHQFNWAAYLGPGIAVYAMLFFTVAACINPKLSSALFLASYAIGMLSDLRTRMPSRLLGWQESIVVLIVSSCLLGWRMTVFSMLFIFAVQCIDDCIDLKIDRRCELGTRNLACRLGIVECCIIGLIALLSAWRLNEALFIPVITGATIFYIAMLHFQGVKT
ncbi:MAG: hypothetical protein H6Q73_2877 [Firmicutes bacterium]|nr:hypothetical protein [Bacillota bacterium]